MLLVVYDVSDDSRRLRLSRALERHGLSRVQRSAFVGRAAGPRAKDVARAATEIIDPATDVVHLVPVPEHFWASAIVLGRPWSMGAPEPEGFEVVLS